MTDRELLRLHVEAGWGLTLPPLDETTHDLVASRPLPPWSLYLGAGEAAEVAIWRPEIVSAQRPRLLERARRAGVAWEPALRMRREVVFAAPTIATLHMEHAQRRAHP